MSASKPPPWICGNCRSINDADRTRCYSCRFPRALAIDPSVAAVRPLERTPGSATPEARLELARTAGARYRSSELRSAFARGGVLVVTVMSVLRILYVASLAPSLENPTLGIEVKLDVAFWLSIAEDVLWLLAFVAWGAWLSRVVDNVPALGGGWPSATPQSAFFLTIIPFVNLWRPAGILRDVVHRLSEEGHARLGLVTAWWLALAAAVFLRLPILPAIIARFVLGIVVAILARTFGEVIAVSVLLDVLQLVLLLIAAVLATRLIRLVEELQRDRWKAVGALTPLAVG